MNTPHPHQDPAAYYDVVGLAASAGGLDAFIQVVSLLKNSFAAPIMVLQHLQSGRASALVPILNGKTELAVIEAAGGETMRPGTIYVSPPDFHLTVGTDHKIALSSAARVGMVRPSADLFFKSLAEVFGARAIAVVLSGMGKDGCLGIQTVRERGGYVIAQDEATSKFFSMPEAAIETGSVNSVLPVAKIASALELLVSRGEAL